MSESISKFLDHHKIEQIINRIAYQIYEDNYECKKLIIAGIAESGYILAQHLQNKLQQISPMEIILEELIINKKNPELSDTSLTLNKSDIKNQTIILVDDVLNSGKTMMHGIHKFMNVPVKKISTAVLINRSHKRFPVHADYVGLSLATTLKEHIEVSLEKGKFAAYLS